MTRSGYYFHKIMMPMLQMGKIILKILKYTLMTLFIYSAGKLPELN